MQAPSRDSLLRHLWEQVIDRDWLVEFPSARWDDIGDEPAFAEVSAIIDKLLDAGASQAHLQAFARAVSYGSVFSTLHSLSDPGVSEGDSLLYLYEELLMADPSGLEGKRPSGELGRITDRTLTK